MWRHTVVNSSNASLLEDNFGDCISCRCKRDDCHCYGRPDADSFMLAPDSDLIGDLLAECRGLHYDNIPAGSMPIPSFQDVPFIPVVTGGSKKLFPSDYSASQYVGVTLDDVLNHAKTHVKLSIRESCGIPDTCKLILLMHGDDATLEKFRANEDVVIRELSTQNIDIVVAPNYSTWKGHPNIEQQINMKLQLVSYDLMCRAGLTTIPHFLWRASYFEDLTRIAEWLNMRSSIQTIAINLQTYRSVEDWEQVTNELRVLYSLLENSVHFIIIGPTTESRLTKLTNILGSSFTLMTAQPAILAWSRTDIIYSQGYIRKRVYARSSKNQTSLLDTDFIADKSLVVSTLFAGSVTALTNRIIQDRAPNVLHHVKAAASMRLFTPPKTSRKSVHTRPTIQLPPAP